MTVLGSSETKIYEMPFENLFHMKKKYYIDVYRNYLFQTHENY